MNTSCVAGVIGVIGVLGVMRVLLSIVVVIVDVLFVGFLLVAAFQHSTAKHFNFVGDRGLRPP
jgi:hypothetical protein